MGYRRLKTLVTFNCLYEMEYLFRPVKGYRLVIIVRNFSKKSKIVSPKNKSENIKDLNYENKSLFGAVRRRKQSVGTISNNNVRIETEQSSEAFWLTRNKSNESVESKLIFPISEKSMGLLGNSLGENNIPFTNADLESMLKFPYIYKKDAMFFEKMQTNCCSVKLPSVGKVLSATMPEASRKTLMNWKIKQISELGADGFKMLEQDHLQKGKLMHRAVELYFSTGAEPTKDEIIYDLWQSLVGALQKFKFKKNLSEVELEHPILKYRGIIDCISIDKSNVSVIEFKKSDKLKKKISDTYDAPLQLCAYAGALNYMHQYRMNIKNGFVIIAYSNGTPADVHEMTEIEFKMYWRLFLQRLQEFWIRTKSRTLPDPL